MSDTDKDLETMFPQPITVAAGGEQIEIMPLKTARFFKAAALFKPLLANVASSGIAKVFQGSFVADSQSIGQLIDVLAESGDDFIRLLALLVNRPESFINELDIDETLALAAKAVEVNLDFFSRRLVMPGTPPPAP